MSTQQPTAAQLSASLTAQSLPNPSPSFLNAILSTSTRLPPDRALISLTATARHRLITSDLTTPSLLSPSAHFLPANISDVRIVERELDQDVFTQVVDVEDLGKSLWEQIEALESERKGETTKGREVIRVIAPTPENDIGSTASTQALGSHNAGQHGGSKGPFKVLLQDWKGTQVWGFEVRKVEKIGLPPGMSVGCKVMLKKGTQVARGLVLLEPGVVVVAGGRVDALEKKWVEGREGKLRDRVKRGAEEGRGENGR